MRRTPLVLLAVTLGLGACGGDGGLSDREQAYADAFAADLADEDDGFGVEREGARCIGDAIMGELGAEPFEEADVEPEDITEGDDSPGQLLGDGAVTDDQADRIVDEWFGCADVPGTFAEQSSDEFGLDAAGVACFEDELREQGVLVRYLHVSFTSDSEEAAQSVLGDVVALVQQCSAGDEGGGILVDSIAASLADDGQLTPDESRCVAQSVVDTVGADRLIEITGGDFASAPPEAQAEMSEAILGATAACGIPPARLGG